MNKRIVFYLLTFVLVLGFTETMVAQSKIPNLQTIDVDELSDEQIRKFIDQVETGEYSQEQLEMMARARGLSEIQILKLRQRVEDFQIQTNSSTISDAELREQFDQIDTEIDAEFSNLEDPIMELESRVFGSQLFMNRNLSFEPSLNIPTPDDYQLGPGDELTVDIWGASEKTYQLTIGPEGTVKIPNIGPVYVNGMQVNLASQKILGQLSKIYAGLTDSNYGKKNTYGLVSLSRIRSIKVNIIGEIQTPGTYTISSLSTVLHALYIAGGPTDNGSYREIQIFRNGVNTLTFDLYDFLIHGDNENNITLKDQDVIKIPVYTERVEIRGEIKTAGIFELKKNESLQSLINYAGGFTDEAYTKLVTIRRKTPEARKILSVKSDQFEIFQMVTGDEVTITKILDIYENRVEIKGAVYRPGEYELTNGLTLKELISKSDGLLPEAYMNRGHIQRYSSDFTLFNLDFSVSDVISGKVDYPLFPEDIITINSRFDLQDTLTVTIQGEIRNPAKFLFQDSLT
ncbi:MAG: SLBB domain-containing protein, partial [Cyclobacteriaceae bacterium]|nr:SLBB domain-containing protein [Cyclobacteriaceae bacterium]